MESMIAAINAGADAVYMGGSRFGARAYADNPEEDQFLQAIDYAHLHGCRLYMTVNTLVKECEFDQLYDYLKPYYEAGLDAVIVQDLGVLSFIRKAFPDMAVHASTQMTVTSYRFAAELKRIGVTRVVPARELSLEELKKIHDNVDIEIESFVHGALCYCYSGQCLLSSLIGGRSGNRGRCAQPCRLPYDVEGSKDKKNRYVLSMKDLNSLDILPDIIEAGVYSLKIEGRMKSPRYTAGVVSVYRKYVDLYLKNGRKGYKVDPADKQMLLDLFDRGGQTEGYYRQHNGRDMIALKEKPAFREANQGLFDRLDKEYVNAKKQEPITGYLKVHEGEPAELVLTAEHVLIPEDQEETDIVTVSVTGDAVQTAQNQPMTEEKLRKQMNKTGNAAFYFEALYCDIEGACFMPLQSLNELRRQGMEQMEQAVLAPFRRSAVSKDEAVKIVQTLSEEAQNTETLTSVKNITSEQQSEKAKSDNRSYSYHIHVSLEEPDGLPFVLAQPDVESVYLDAVGFAAERWAADVRKCHEAGKTCALILPQIFRMEAERYLKAHCRELREAGFDAFVLRSMEEIGFLKEQKLDQIPQIFDANLYVMNRPAAGFMQKEGAGRLTLPLELNSRELEDLGCENRELVVYGYLPVMVSAQCIRRTTTGCTKKPEVMYMKDRTGKDLPVKNHCRFCYNTIYNPSPLSLLGQEKLVERLSPSVLRLQFTIERPEQMKEIIHAYADHFLYGQDTPAPYRDFTRGHMKRGVE
jgi:putative protease